MRDTSQTKSASEERQKAASGLEENRARARTEAKRLKFSLFERSEFEDFSGADGLASDFLQSHDLFDSFLYLDKNEHQVFESGGAPRNEQPLSMKKTMASPE
ncbi:MAG: hypothetical protein BRD35_02145 [Bacteroidetes bacterium QH_7_62_13]|nr:MAG: hypothetical protein BRD35_02145 [Bacteroidetes bacterium QH_7_62_13]